MKGPELLYGVCDCDQERLLKQRGIGDDQCRWAFDDQVKPRTLRKRFRHLGRDMGDLSEVSPRSSSGSRVPKPARAS